jgi:hypothetical protein
MGQHIKIKQKCKCCEKLFDARLCEVRLGRALYCSRKCAAIAFHQKMKLEKRGPWKEKDQPFQGT